MLALSKMLRRAKRYHIAYVLMTLILIVVLFANLILLPQTSRSFASLLAQVALTVSVFVSFAVNWREAFKASGNPSASSGGKSEVVAKGAAFIEQDTPLFPEKEIYQLPPPTDDFVGRETEIERLLAEIREGRSLVSIQGMPGVGKTTLALKLAWLIKPEYPDGQIYLRLQGTTSRPLTAGEVLTQVLHSFYPTAQTSGEESELLTRYLSALAGKRVLLLLDDAFDFTQVEIAVPPPGCVLILTSRRRFTLPRLYSCYLEPLTPDRSRDLLLRLAPRIGEYAHPIAELCGYRPFALRQAGSLLAERVNLAPEDYIRHLKNEESRVELIKAQISLSYNLLSEELRRLWCRLAIFRDTFDEQMAAIVWNLRAEKIDKNAVDVAREKLSQLMSYSLVEFDKATRTYHLDNLTHLFMNECLGTGERLEVVNRYVARLLIQGCFDEAVLLLQGEIEWFSRNKEQVSAARCYCELAVAYIYKSHFDLAFAALEEARKERANTGTSLLNAYIERAEGLLNYEQGHRQEAITLLLHAAEAFKALAYNSEVSFTWLLLAEVQRYIDPKEALPWVEESRKIPGPDGAFIHTGRCDFVQALIYCEMNQYHECLDLCSRAHSTFAQGEADFLQALCENTMGIAYRALRQRDLAITCFNKARTSFAAKGLTSLVDRCQFNIALIYFDSGDYTGAFRRYKYIAQAAIKEGRRDRVARCYLNMGKCDDRLGRYEQAVSLYNRARKIFIEEGSPTMVAKTELGLAESYYHQNHLDLAHEYLMKAREAFAVQDREEDLASCNKQLAQLRETAGQYEAALTCLGHAQMIYERLGFEEELAYCKREMGRLWAHKLDRPEIGVKLVNEARAIYTVWNSLNDIMLCDDLLQSMPRPAAPG